MKCKLFLAALISMITIGSANALVVATVEQGPFVLTIDETTSANGKLNYLFSVQYNGTDVGANAFEIHATTENPVVGQVDLSGFGFDTIFNANNGIMGFVGEQPSNDTQITGNPSFKIAVDSPENGGTTYENANGIHAAFAYDTPSRNLNLFQIVVPNGGVVNTDGSSASEPITWEVQLASDGDFEIMEGVIGLPVPEPASLAIFGLAGAMFIRRRRNA